MDLLNILQISASGLTAERTRLQTVSSNIANAQTTRTEEGGLY
jgi:flagellar basal-body rod protein FlgC